MKNLIWISVLSIFLWACKGSAGSASSSSTVGTSNQSTSQGNQGANQNNPSPENNNANQQNKGTNSDIKYKSGSDVQNTSIKKQYPAAK